MMEILKVTVNIGALIFLTINAIKGNIALTIFFGFLLIDSEIELLKYRK